MFRFALSGISIAENATLPILVGQTIDFSLVQSLNVLPIIFTTFRIHVHRAIVQGLRRHLLSGFTATIQPELSNMIYYVSFATSYFTSLTCLLATIAAPQLKLMWEKGYVFCGVRIIPIQCVLSKSFSCRAKLPFSHFHLFWPSFNCKLQFVAWQLQWEFVQYSL